MYVDLGHFRMCRGPFSWPIQTTKTRSTCEVTVGHAGDVLFFAQAQNLLLIIYLFTGGILMIVTIILSILPSTKDPSTD